MKEYYIQSRVRLQFLLIELKVTVTLELSADSAACPSSSESCLEWAMMRFVKIILFRLISQKYCSRGAVVVWVAAEYVFGVMMGVRSEHHRLGPASHWSQHCNTVF